MTREHECPRWSGSGTARATWIAAAILGLASPVRAQGGSRFSPRPANEGDTPAGPSLAIYAGVARGYDDHLGSAFGVELDAVRVGPARGLVGILAGKVAGSAEVGLLVQPERESATSPYVGASWFIAGLDDGDTGIAFHVGAEVRHTRELGLRVEGRAYLADKAALAALVGFAFR